MDSQYEALMRQNAQLERDVSELKELLEQERAEKNQLLNHNEDNKLLIGKLNRELEVARKKLVEDVVNNNERKIKYEEEVSRLRHEIDKRQKEIEDMQAQSIKPMDMNILRMKMKEEFETSYALESEDKAMIAKLKEERDELRRNLQFLDTKHEGLKIDSQREIESNKLKYKEELQGLIQENQHLQSQIEMSKDREMLRQSRRELDETKRRIEEYQKECNELRKQRDSLRDEKNDCIISHNRDIEEERSRKREAIAENDKLKFKIRSLEDDLQKQMIENDKRNQSIMKLKTEKQNIHSLINEKELAIESTRRLLEDARDHARDKENELQSHLRRRADFELVEKNRLEKLECDLRNLQKEYRIQEVEGAKEREKHSEQFNRLEYNYKSIMEENRKLKATLMNVEKDSAILNQQLDKKQDEFLVIEREYKKYQEQNRQFLVDKEELKKLYDDARLENQLTKDKNVKITKAHDMASQAWTREKKDLEKRITLLLRNLDSYKSEGTREQLIEYKKKTNEYKRKVRAANDTIAKLGNKLAILGAPEEYEEEYQAQYAN